MASNAENVSIWWRHHGGFLETSLQCPSPENVAWLEVAKLQYIQCVSNFSCTLSFSTKNDEFYIIVIYPCLNRSVCLSMVSPNYENLAFVQAGDPSCSDDVTHRSCTNFKCKVAYVNIGIPIDFRAVNALMWNRISHIVKQIHSVRLMCTAVI